LELTEVRHLLAAAAAAAAERSEYIVWQWSEGQLQAMLDFGSETPALTPPV
jgi:hypothetical protein